MKIYSKLVISLATGKILEAVESDYCGPIARCGGGKAPKMPGPSEEERRRDAEQAESLRLQREIIEKQYKEQQLLAPFLYKQIGIKPVYDDKGAISGYEEIPDENRALEKDIQSQFLKRTQSALKGELPIDPTLLSELGTQERTLNERLRQQLGAGYETSTPGIEALARFQKSKGEMLSAASRGDLTLAESLGLARTQSNEQKLSDILSQTAGVNTMPFGAAAGFGQNAAGFGQAANNLRQDRYQQAQMLMANAQNSASTFGSLMGGIGSLFGTALGMGAKKFLWA